MAYAKGIITIPNVSGNIAVTVTTAPKPIVNLFQKTPSKQATGTAEAPGDTVYLGARLNSSHMAVYRSETMLVTRPIPASYGDVFHITTDLANNSDVYAGGAYLYDANGDFIAEIMTEYFDGRNWSWGRGYLNGTLTIAAADDLPDISGTAAIRFALAYTDIDNIEISKE